jgi:protoporphyrin/coproporphyrin ferrochelatase
MTGVLLVNMGGPRSLEEMKIFLSNMFKDPYILPFHKPLRYLLGYVISSARYKKSWKKYELIGGTPIISATEKTVTGLSKKLNSHYIVKMAFSYSAPFIEESLLAFKNEGIKNITVIPLYPQSSYSTTSSVLADVNKSVSRDKELNIKFVRDFYKHERFIMFWSEIISEHILENQYRHPFLLFSAHSIPEYLVDKGDTYPIGIEESAKLIARNIGVEYDFSYQSGMSRGKWLTPDTKQRLKELALKGVGEIILIPISFVNENLETLYDLDHDIIPYAKNELGIGSVSRVKIPEAHEMFIGLLADLVKTDL